MRPVGAFSPAVVKRLGFYVNRLIDPRNGETFYIGKGRGNRVFAHIRGEPSTEGDDLDNKIKRIREIRLSNLDVAHVIHRHGMDETTAMEVEAALIDAYPGLTNIAGGVASDARGAMHASEIIRRYDAEEAVFRHKALLININRSASDASTYDATRFAWKINPSKAMQADVVLAVVQGLIVDAFVAEKWMPANTEGFPDHPERPGRFGFIGHEATPELKELYVGKRVPDKFRRQGAANPIKYSWS